MAIRTPQTVLAVSREEDANSNLGCDFVRASCRSFVICLSGVVGMRVNAQLSVDSLFSSVLRT